MSEGAENIQRHKDADKIIIVDGFEIITVNWYYYRHCFLSLETVNT